MALPVPLSTLLSQALIAYTVELDDAFEEEMGGAALSLLLWPSFMRVVGEKGATVDELAKFTRHLGSLERHRWVTVNDGVVTPTSLGRRAQEVWPRLFGVIEKRWHTRFGQTQLAQLKKALLGVAGKLDDALPDYFPELGHGMAVQLPDHEEWAPAAELDLYGLLARVLVAFTVAFEQKSEVSLALGANILRVLDDTGVRAGDLPRLTGVCRDALATSVGLLARQGYVVLEPDPAATRGKIARLTSAGQRAQDTYRWTLAGVETQWQSQFGKRTMHNLRRSLESLVDERLADGLDPPPGSWRRRPQYSKQTTAILRDPAGALPHFPMTMRQGGWPDGA